MGTIDKSDFVNPDAAVAIKTKSSTTRVNTAEELITTERLTQVIHELKYLKQPDGGIIRPLVPYMRYSNKMFENVQQSNPSLKLPEIGRTIGQQWRNMPPAEKQVYVDAYELEKEPYLAAVQRFQCSDEYQSYLRRKEMLENRRRHLERELHIINGKTGGDRDAGSKGAADDQVNVSSIAQSISSFMSPVMAVRQNMVSGGLMLPSAAPQQVAMNIQPSYRFPPRYMRSYYPYEQPSFPYGQFPQPVHHMPLPPGSVLGGFPPMPFSEVNHLNASSHFHAFRENSADASELTSADSGMCRSEKHQLPSHTAFLPHGRQPPLYLSNMAPLHAQTRGFGIPSASQSAPHPDSLINNAVVLRQPRSVDAAASQKLAGERFRHNQALMYEIFDETPVPDAPVITQARVDLLRQQIAHLEMHRKRLVKEVEELDRQCAETSSKRRRSDYYNSDYADGEPNLFDDDDELKPKNVPGYVVTPEKFTEMVENAFAEMVAADQLRRLSSNVSSSPEKDDQREDEKYRTVAVPHNHSEPDLSAEIAD